MSDPTPVQAAPAQPSLPVGNTDRQNYIDALPDFAHVQRDACGTLKRVVVPVTWDLMGCCGDNSGPFPDKYMVLHPELGELPPELVEAGLSHQQWAVFAKALGAAQASRPYFIENFCMFVACCFNAPTLGCIGMLCSKVRLLLWPLAWSNKIKAACEHLTEQLSESGKDVHVLVKAQSVYSKGELQYQSQIGGGQFYYDSKIQRFVVIAVGADEVAKLREERHCHYVPGDIVPGKCDEKCSGMTGFFPLQGNKFCMHPWGGSIDM